MNSMPFRQLKSFLKILIGVQYDRMKESNFLILFVGCALLRLFKILAGRVHIEFNFPKLLRILPDGFELGIGSPIHGIHLIKVLWQLRQKRVRHYAGEAWDGQLCRREQPGRSDADGFHSAPVGGLDTCG